MAKRTRRKYWKRRTRWAANIADIGTSIGITSGIGEFSGTATLVTNPVQSSLSTSQIYTIKNVEATFDLAFANSASEDAGSGVERLTVYIMFVPQGMNVGEDYNILHPEYILNYRFIGAPMADNNIYRNPVRVKTRLARKLNTGDSIILFIKGNKDITSAIGSLQINGVVRWWTKAN